MKTLTDSSFKKTNMIQEELENKLIAYLKCENLRENAIYIPGTCYDFNENDSIHLFSSGNISLFIEIKIENCLFAITTFNHSNTMNVQLYNTTDDVSEYIINLRQIIYYISSEEQYFMLSLKSSLPFSYNFHVKVKEFIENIKTLVNQYKE